MNGQKHTYRYAAMLIISERYFRKFCRAFGLREIIVMLNYLCNYVIAQRFALVLSFYAAELSGIFNLNTKYYLSS